MTQQINLYDPELRRRVELLTLTNLVLTSLVLLSIVILAATWLNLRRDKREAEATTLSLQSKLLQDQVQSLGQRIGTQKPNLPLEQSLATLKEQLSARSGMLALLQRGLGPAAVSFAEYLRGLARQTPHGLWLTGFVVNGDGGGMEIQGRTVDPALVPGYIKRLNVEQSFHGVAFSALQLGVPAPAVGTNAGPGAAASTPRPAFHEFTLVSSLQATSMTGQIDAAPVTAAKPSLVETVLGPEAAMAFRQANGSAGGGRP